MQQDRIRSAGRSAAQMMAVAIIWLATAICAWSQTFSSGSTGADGALLVPATSGTVTLAVPPNGIFNFTTIEIQQGATLKFTRNTLNTPVHLLATGDVRVAGTIDVSGASGKSNPPAGGLGGPGGFDGGMPGILGAAPGNGHGPGGGKGGDTEYPYTAGSAGSGSYGNHAPGSAYGVDDYSIGDGVIYGSPLLVPLLGGSGGGGTTGQPGRGGAGGGGAILIASNTQIQIPQGGVIRSKGGDNDNSDSQGVSPAQGSGGAIRLVAPVVFGNGTLDVNGGWTNYYYGAGGGHGRIRIDCLDRSALAIQSAPSSAASIGSFMTVFPSPMPRLDIIHAAGQDIPEGTPNPVQVILPFDSPATQTVTVQARDFKGVVPIDLVLIPDNGNKLVYPLDINMAGGNTATISTDVQMPKNTVVHIYAWTR